MYFLGGRGVGGLYTIYIYLYFILGFTLVRKKTEFLDKSSKNIDTGIFRSEAVSYIMDDYVFCGG